MMRASITSCAISLSLLTGCTASLYYDPQNSFESLWVRTAGFGIDATAIQNGQVEMSSLHSGRTHCFTAENSNHERRTFSCSDLENKAFIDQWGHLCVRYPAFVGSGSYSFSCRAGSSTAFTIKINYSDSNLALLTEGEVPSLFSYSTASISADGTKIAYGVQNGQSIGAYDQVAVHLLSQNQTLKVSANSSGILGNSNSSTPLISGDGNYVVFSSDATNLVSGITGSHVYRKNLQSGVVELVSSNVSGTKSNGTFNTLNGLSSDGRYVVFSSDATNLVGGATGGQVYRKDMQSGTVALASSTTGGVQGNASSYSGCISGDGRYVSFNSIANNLIGGVGANHVYRKDLESGTLVLVSSDSGGTQGNAASSSPISSSDGRYVAFYSLATNLVGGASGSQIYRKDLQTGAVVLVSSSSSGTLGNNGSSNPTITADGRYVVFTSTSTNLITGVTGVHAYRKDLQTDAIILASSNAAGVKAEVGASYPVVSSDGRYVAFLSFASNLVSGISGNQVYRKDMNSEEVIPVSQDIGGTHGNSGSYSPAVSPDGTYVAFQSGAGNLGSVFSSLQIYRKNLTTGSISLVSSDAQGVRGNGTSDLPSLSSDGRYIAFQSDATNFISGAAGTNIYRKDMQTLAIEQVSADPLGGLGAGDGIYPSISADGRYVTFLSGYPFTVAGTHIYRRDMQATTIELVSCDDLGTPGNDISHISAISANGRYVAFLSDARNLNIAGTMSGHIYRKDMQTGVVDLVSSDALGVEANAPSIYPSISADGRYVTFASSTTNLIGGVSGNMIYRKDVQTGNVDLVSSNSLGVQANMWCNDPSFISADGRYVVFQSVATNLVAGATSLHAFRKDMQTGAVTLVSSDATGLPMVGSLISAIIFAQGNYAIFGAVTKSILPGIAHNQVFLKKLD